MGFSGMNHGLFFLPFLVIFVIPAWRIVSKAGYNGAFSLLLLVPFVNVIALWVFAFAEWPAQGRRE